MQFCIFVLEDVFIFSGGFELEALSPKPPVYHAIAFYYIILSYHWHISTSAALCTIIML